MQEIKVKPFAKYISELLRTDGRYREMKLYPSKQWHKWRPEEEPGMLCQIVLNLNLTEI